MSIFSHPILANRSFPLIDTHCHIFNASDLSVTGFLRAVVLDTDESDIKKVADPLVKYLGKLLRKAPSADDEHRWLDKKFRSRQTANLAATGVLDGSEREQQDVEFLSLLEQELENLTISDDEGDQELLELIVSEHQAEIASNPLLLVYVQDLDVAQRGLGGVARGLLRGIGAVGRYVKWVRLLKKYRWEIFEKLRDAFGQPNEGIDLFTPALVDYEYWLDDRPDTAHPAQNLLMSRFSRLLPGRVHALAAFDPWRESEAPGTQAGSLYWVKRAIQDDAFIGVKLYPPMGYAALGNADLDFSAVGQHESAKFGAKLDTAMRALFTWAEGEGVPIMAHASNSIVNKAGYGLRAGPEYWCRALAEFPNLRVNFAHFGGQGALADPNGWASGFIQLMDAHPNTYADIGHFDDILEEDRRDELLDRLQALLTRAPILEDRLMFGTDWSMLAREADWKEYVELFIEGLSTRLPPDVVQNLMGVNAVRFYGLAGQEPNAVRLRAFYMREMLPMPFWLA